MRILHIATDNKFLDHAYPVFERVYPGANELFIFAPDESLKFVKQKPGLIEKKPRTVLRARPKVSSETYQKYDLVVFHSLDISIYPELKSVPKSIPTVWLGWGYDYYDVLPGDAPLLLKATQALYSHLVEARPRQILFRFIKKIMGGYDQSVGKIRAIEKVTIFCPVLPEEYEIVRNARRWRHFPKFAPWNYGTIEDNFIKGFEGESVTGDAILVGNSATFTGNHLEAFELLRRLKMSGRQIVVPLSYGNKELATFLIDKGKEYFANEFESLTDFMPIEEYVAIIKRCGYVIMNHVRQQAVGNIVIMLYLGARVFIRKENPVYDFFKQSGVILSAVQELETYPKLLETPLTAEERLRNRTFVRHYWSRENAHERTQQLVEKAFSEKGLKIPEKSAGSY